MREARASAGLLGLKFPRRQGRCRRRRRQTHSPYRRRGVGGLELLDGLNVTDVAPLPTNIRLANFGARIFDGEGTGMWGILFGDELTCLLMVSFI